jgi:hypothetical protein
VSDEPDVTGSEEPTQEQRFGVLEDAVGLAHRHIGELRYELRTNTLQIVLLGVGVVLIATAMILLTREGVEVDGGTVS